MEFGFLQYRGRKIERVPAGLKLTLSGDYEGAGNSGCCPGGDWSDSNVEGLGLENAGLMSFPGSIEGPGYSTTNAIAVNEYSQTSQ